MKNQSVINMKKKIQEELKENLINSQDVDDINTKKMYMNFRDM